MNYYAVFLGDSILPDAMFQYIERARDYMNNVCIKGQAKIFLVELKEVNLHIGPGSRVS